MHQDCVWLTPSVVGRGWCRLSLQCALVKCSQTRVPTVLHSISCKHSLPQKPFHFTLVFLWEKRATLLSFLCGIRFGIWNLWSQNCPGVYMAQKVLLPDPIKNSPSDNNKKKHLPTGGPTLYVNYWVFSNRQNRIPNFVGPVFSEAHIWPEFIACQDLLAP